MTYEQEMKLARLQGTLKGTRHGVQAQVRISHTLATDFHGTGAGIAYRCGIPSLVGTLRNIRQAERELDEFIKKAQNV